VRVVIWFSSDIYEEVSSHPVVRGVNYDLLVFWIELKEKGIKSSSILKRCRVIVRVAVSRKYCPIAKWNDQRRTENFMGLVCDYKRNHRCVCSALVNHIP
jgi:hypothetical protein